MVRTYLKAEGNKWGRDWVEFDGMGRFFLRECAGWCTTALLEYDQGL